MSGLALMYVVLAGVSLAALAIGFRLAASGIHPALGTAIYNQAKRSPCTLRFHIAAEAGWDMGGASALLIAAGLLAVGVPIGACILLSLLGAMASFLLLRRYYAVPEPAVTPAIAEQ